MCAPFGEQRQHQIARLQHSLDALGRRYAGFGIALETPLHPAAIARAILFGDAEHRADHVHRQRVRERGLEIEIAAGAAQRIEAVLREAPDLRLQLGDAPRGEAPGDQVAEPHVTRRIHADDRHHLARNLPPVFERRTEGRAVRLPVERGLPHVLETEQCVEVHLRVVGARLAVAEVAVERVGIFLDLARVRVVDHVDFPLRLIARPARIACRASRRRWIRRRRKCRPTPA